MLEAKAELAAHIRDWRLSMEAYRIEKRVIRNGVLELDALPFKEGDLVEVIVLGRNKKVRQSTSSPLQGKVIQYIDPTEPVAQEDWELLK
jgi:hypothetical protein